MRAAVPKQLTNKRHRAKKTERKEGLGTQSLTKKKKKKKERKMKEGL